MICRTAFPAVTSPFAAILLAASSGSGLDELDQVVVTASRQLVPLEEFLEFPKYEDVAISPDGKHIAMVWMPASNQYW